MSEQPKSHLSRPPYNPGVRELVAGKQHWSARSQTKDLPPGFRGWHERGYLPHRDEPGLIQLVTFRLIDSFPESLRSEWEHLWKIEDNEKRRAELECYLDKGRGECHLRLPEIAKMVEQSLLLFHGGRYDLRAWVIMPNHVHVLFKVDTMPMAKVVESWKKNVAYKANQQLGRSGRFWQLDYWDTYMRNNAHEQRARQYIENNPSKAHLFVDLKKWPWSSARFRDKYGSLNL